MKFAIIAAGEGSRLAAEGISAAKPLVEVGGEKIIDRLIRIFSENGAEEIVVICNELRTEVRQHLEELAKQRNGSPNSSETEDGKPHPNGCAPIRIVQKTTPSSMHSFFEISPYLSDAPFVLTTVDTIFREEEFKTYVETFRNDGETEGVMGVTDYIDDESPLYVETDSDLRITDFLDRSDSCRYISGGIYGLTPRAIKTLRDCIERGDSRMRNFQRALVRDGMLLKAHAFSKVLDIDHASDIKKAEEFLSENERAQSEKRKSTE